MTKKRVSLAKYAEMCGLPTGYLKRLMKEGKLRHICTGARYYVVPAEADRCLHDLENERYKNPKEVSKVLELIVNE